MKTMTGIRRWLSAVSACACLAFSSPSGATAFQVEFDPYTDLFGTAIFYLTDACVAHDGDYDTPSELVNLFLSGCFMSLQSAHVSTEGASGPFTDYAAELPFVLFSELVIVNKQLAGLTTLVPIRLEPPGGDQVASVASFTLTNGFFHDDCDAMLSFTVAGGVTFKGCSSTGQQLPPLLGTITTIFQIPEPGTLALLAGAGLAGWWTRRRRNAPSRG